MAARARRSSGGGAGVLAGLKHWFFIFGAGYHLGVVDRRNQRHTSDYVANESGDEIVAKYCAPGNLAGQSDVKGLHPSRDQVAEVTKADHIAEDDYDPKPRALSERQQPYHQGNEPPGENRPDQMGCKAASHGLLPDI